MEELSLEVRGLAALRVRLGVRVEVERLMRHKHQVRVEVERLRPRLRRRLELDDAERFERLDRAQLQVVGLAVRVLVEAAQRLRAALLEQQRLERVEVLVHRREAHRHAAQGVHGSALAHVVEVPGQDLLVDLVEGRVVEWALTARGCGLHGARRGHAAERGDARGDESRAATPREATRERGGCVVQ